MTPTRGACHEHNLGESLMKLALTGLLAALVVATSVVAQPAPTPFKLGTFERQGRPFVGIVLRETVVIDFAAAHAAITNPASGVAAPTDMKDLIARYDGLRARIIEIVRTVGDTRPAYVYDVGALKILPPIMYPTTMLNVAVNYREHDLEMARRQGDARTATAGEAPAGTTSAAGIWERKQGDTRWNPFMFIKLPGAIVAQGEAVRLPVGRTQIEWECELGVVDGPPGLARQRGTSPGLRVRLHAAERHVGSRRPRRHVVSARTGSSRRTTTRSRRWARSSRRRSSCVTSATWP